MFKGSVLDYPRQETTKTREVNTGTTGRSYGHGLTIWHWGLAGGRPSLAVKYTLPGVAFRAWRWSCLKKQNRACIA